MKPVAASSVLLAAAALVFQVGPAWAGNVTGSSLRTIGSEHRASPVREAGGIYRPPEDGRYIHIRRINGEGDQVTALVGRPATTQVRRISGSPQMRTIRTTVNPGRHQPPPRGARPIDISNMLVTFNAMASIQEHPVATPPGVRLFSRDRYAAEIFAATSRHGVEEALVRAVIHAESAFRSDAVSHAGAQGLMQLMPPTARRFGVTDSFDPLQNILGGTQYLAWLLKRYDGDITKAAAAYNAGEGAVDRHKGVPPYRETRGYVQRVNQLLPLYRQQVGTHVL